MRTEYLGTQTTDELAVSLPRAVEALRAGGIVAVPTETVYGLAVNADDPAALAKLAALKGRPSDQACTLHLASADDVSRHVDELPCAARKLMERYWPGPLTLILPSADGGTVGLRVPSHDVCREFLSRAGVPVAASSANPHGEEPATDLSQVKAYFDGQIDVALDGGTTVLRQSSTILRFNGESFEVLREGIITAEMVHKLVGAMRILFVCTGNSCRSPMAAALFRKHLASKLGVAVDELTRLGYRIRSAGVFAPVGNPASDNAVLVMEEMECDISEHRTQPLTEDLAQEADRIFALGASHFQLAIQLFPWTAEKLSMIGDGVTDPIGGDLETYRNCANEIDLALRKIVQSF